MTQTRIQKFVAWFLQTDYYANQWGVSSDDWINDPERAGRCADAAEHGCDGSTNAERIQDMRDAFSAWMSDRRTTHTYTLFEDAVNAHFDSLEAWHENNGSLDTQVG